MNPWNLDVDLERVARLLKETGITFGYCLGCWCDPRPAAAQSAIDYVAKRHQGAEAQYLKIPLNNREHLYAAVIGAPIRVTGEKQSPAPVGEQPQTG